MDINTVLNTLESLGTDQNRKVYPRHGVGENLYGVSFADLGKLAKQIKKNTALALDLWESGNQDARMLATMIADPRELDQIILQKWAEELDNYILTDAFSKLVFQSESAETKMNEWMSSNDEWKGRAGWRLVAHLALEDKSLPDEYFDPLIELIESTIHLRKNYVRDAMNSALIAIGVRSTDMQTKALAAAARIGKVNVDHGQTNCKTPDASSYILKTWARRIEKPRKI